MGRVSKDAVLGGSNLPEKEIEVPELGGSLLIQRLPAAFAVDSAEYAPGEKDGPLEVQVKQGHPVPVLMFAYGVKDPSFTVDEAWDFARKYDTGLFTRVVKSIDEMSELDDASVKAAEARFQDGGDSGTESAADAGSD